MRIRTLACALALAALPAIARAQHPIEFGVDAGISVTDGDPKLTSISVPVQSLRVGFYVTERVAIEPAVGFSYQKWGDLSNSTFMPELGLVYDFSVDRKAMQPFVRPFAGATRSSVGDEQGSESLTLYNAGLGLGAKIRLGSIERFAWRIEAVYDHRFEDKDKAVDAENAFGLKLGLSFFTH